MSWWPRPRASTTHGSTRRDGWRRMRRAPGSILAPWLILFLVSCGGEPQLALPATPSAMSTAEAPSSVQLPASPVSREPAIGEIVWTTQTEPASGSPASTVSHVPADAPRIVAVAMASDLPAGVSVEASWFYNDTPLEGFSTAIPIEQHIDESWLSFHIERSPDVHWPAGQYEITIQLDGEVVQEASIDVWEPT